ncbi:Lrp/AsnC ligand binding domain-containing protein [Meiothermus sp. CFH 77666]|uniref:Lrp/AsnC ligand binding domain-containing protein n=1 Tax=Meiothermus sp. CFH 77666 TaxID=2817942 RepID=UPI001AA0AFC1|nr:Lrp/AsnC ligand binding domain-containing protein [Meiothermus sp. CFH 77666]MBO1437493.1 Lrp/AsnC ligand binding domain-containing protein [Meiothermus sp. CFH 77666]
MFSTFFWEVEARDRQQRLLEDTVGIGPTLPKAVQEARMMQLAQQVQVSTVGNIRPVSAYVFVSCTQPKRIAHALSRLPGVVKADALLGASEAVLVVERHNFEALQTLLTEVQSTPGVKKVSVKLAA